MQTDTLRKSPNAFCRAEVKAIKHKLPYNVREIIYKRYPEYNTGVGAYLINNVLTGRTTDLRLTEILKEIANENKTI